MNHSVCKWCLPRSSVEELAQAAATIGLKSVELLEPHEWPILEKYGLVCAMPFGPGIEGKDRLTDGFNEPSNHEWLVPMYQERIIEVAEAGYDRVIWFSGNRRGNGGYQGPGELRNGSPGYYSNGRRIWGHGMYGAIEQ